MSGSAPATEIVDAILFDMDGQLCPAVVYAWSYVSRVLDAIGTLVDSTRATDETFRRFVEKHNLDLSGHPHARLPSMIPSTAVFRLIFH